MMDLRRKASSSESEGEAVDSSVKILINDVTPCDSREFLHLPFSVQNASHVHLAGMVQKESAKGSPNRRASWTCMQKAEVFPKPQRCWSLGSLVPDAGQISISTSDALSFCSRFSNTKDSSDSIPEGMREKQRSFSAGSREDVFMFCNQMQDSIQSMNDMMAGVESCTLSARIEPKPAKKHSLITFGNKSTHKEDWLVAPRSTLQKSVSTPSIVAAQEIQEIAYRRDGRDSVYGRNRFSAQNVRNSCIEIMHEDDEPEEMNIKRLSSFSLANLLRENVLKTGTQEGEEDKPFSKRKKRGSLFFRKKKNKDKDKDKESKKHSSHQFVSICFSTAATCDVCSRGLANKSALKCENCSVTVHDSSCKDHVPHCIQHKVQPPSATDKEVNSSLLVPSGSIRYPPRYRHLIGASPLVYSHSSVQLGKYSQPIREKRSSVTDNTRITLSSSTDSSKITPPSSNKVICEEKEVEVVEDTNTNILETNSASMESLDDTSQGTSDVEDDAMLQLLDEEPETWNGTVDKKVLKKLKEKDVKRQEAIYELILTEKHHCLTLKVMQRVYAKGMMQELNVSRDIVQRIFPSLEELLRVHLTFLQRLRERQRNEAIVSHVGDLILQQFDGQNAEELCACYSQFCSQHKEALSLYKDILKSDRKFQSFIKKCGSKSFCKARGIPECILLVTQRVTKYPLLIDALIKTAKDNKLETDKLNRALINIKEIVTRVNSAVAEKDREVRLLEIYNKIDAKSTACYKKKKFKKSDLLCDSRKLRFEGGLEWKSARGKVMDVHVIILSDVIVILQESNQKYTFASLDNKAAIISLQKLLVREKAGQNSRGIYLISSNPSDPEMYEMLCSSSKDKKLWLQVIRDSVSMLASEEVKGFIKAGNKTENHVSSSDDKASKLADLCATMQEKDMEVVGLCEEKIKAMLDAMELLGFERQKIPTVNFPQLLQKDEEETEHCLLATLSQACHLASRMFYFDTNPYINSVECATSACDSPVLPKRAETFGGFDSSGREASDKVNILKKKLMQLKEMDGDTHGERELSCSDSSLHIKSKDVASNLKFISTQGSPQKVPDVIVSRKASLGGFSHIEKGAELNQLLATAMSLLHHHLSICRKEYGKRRYRPDHQLEELRNIQEKLSQERLQWEHDKAKQEQELQRRKDELLHMQKLLYEEQNKQQQASSDKNKLTCYIEGKDCNHNCSSQGLCRHRRSASFDFRALANSNIAQDIGGRQSWSGPVDDAPFSCRSQFCSTQSTSDIPCALTTSPVFSNANHCQQNVKSVENSTNPCSSSEAQQVDGVNVSYEECGATSETEYINSSGVNKNSSGIKIRFCPGLDMEQSCGKCLCSTLSETDCTKYKNSSSNGRRISNTNKILCHCHDSL